VRIKPPVAIHDHASVVASVRIGPAIGLIFLMALLTALAATVGLGVAGWLAGTGYGVVMAATLNRALNRAGHELGPANIVTLIRATLVGAVTALAADSYWRPVPVAVLTGITIAALALDWVDGQVARRTGTVTPLGGRFDMEVDSFLLLVLGVYVARWYGPWVLAVGAMRYLFVVAMWPLRWMRADLPPRYWRKVVAAVQGIVLVAAASGVLPRPVALAGLIGALVLLIESFGRDVRWLWRHRT
jgi:phosphatidylglycerophosphate synthase